jgi:hypothetical protein
MKGYIYICEMVYDGEFYYKIGKALNVSKREADLKIGNPFLSVVAITERRNYDSAEREIQSAVRQHHFNGEWYKLTKEQYENLCRIFNFEYFTDEKRKNQLQFGHTPDIRKNKNSGIYHIFKKPKKLKNGKTVYRWYYYWVDENKKQHQYACKDCTSRKEAEDYIRNLKK